MSTVTFTATPNSGESAGTATTVVIVDANAMTHPFSDINKAFLQAADDSEARNWCFHKGDIAIDQFLTSITGFLTIFDALGSTAITDIVRKDFRWKTNGLRNSAKRLHAESVRDVVRKELKSPPRFWAPSGIESLLWSHRILSFVEQMVDHLVEDSSLELHDACIRSYRDTLALRHNHMTKVIFERALGLVPSRARFIANLTKHDKATEEDYASCLVGMKEFLRSTRPVIEALRTLFDMEEIDDLGR